MNIIVGHARSYDFEKGLYQPLLASDLARKHTFLLPHKDGAPGHNTKALLADADIFLAEISHPATGLGMELAWASDAGVRIVGIHKKDSRPSSSAESVCHTILEYSESDDMLSILGEAVTSLSSD